MENRFGVKDFVLFVLLIALLVSIWLAMKQFDRQWEQVRAIRGHLDEQSRDLRDIQRQLARGVAVAAPVNVEPTTRTAAASTQPADPNDPFARLRAARELPGFAMGDWLVEAFGGGVAKLTPLLSGDNLASTVQGSILETLATRNPATLEWKPLLAESWTIRDNSDEYDAYLAKMKQEGLSDEQIAADPNLPIPVAITFKMRDGVRFSDGTPLTADDVAFTFDFIMDERIAAPRQRAYYQKIRKVEKTGDNQVTFHFREPYFESFELAATMDVLPKHFYGKYAPEEFNQSVGLLMGSGPYRLESPTDWKPGAPIQLVRNDRYWGLAPAFGRRVYKEISNDVARLTAFRNGDVDTFGAQPEQYKAMINDPGIIARTRHYEYLSPTGGYRYIAWNQKLNGQPTPFADKRVRQALTMLIDKERLVNEVMLGYAAPATGPFNPLSKQSNPDIKPWPYDVARAKSLLAEAGFRDTNGDGVLEGPDGKPFTFKLTYPSGSANYERMVLYLKDAYAKAGIVLEPDPLEWSVFTQRLENKNFQAISLAWTAGLETDIYQMFHSSQMMAGGDNFMSYRNEELDKAISEARSTIKEEQRMPLWHRAHEILHEDQPYTFLFFGKSLVFLDDRINNVQKLKIGLNPREEWFVPTAQQQWTR